MLDRPSAFASSTSETSSAFREDPPIPVSARNTGTFGSSACAASTDGLMFALNVCVQAPEVWFRQRYESTPIAPTSLTVCPPDDHQSETGSGVAPPDAPFGSHTNVTSPLSVELISATNTFQAVIHSAGVTLPDPPGPYEFQL